MQQAKFLAESHICGGQKVVNGKIKQEI